LVVYEGAISIDQLLQALIGGTSRGGENGLDLKANGEITGTLAIEE
jgi:hypothetical protein